MIYSIRKKYFIALLLLALTALPGELGDLTGALVTDAYVQVSAFVAITLSIFYFSESKFTPEALYRISEIYLWSCRAKRVALAAVV